MYESVVCDSTRRSRSFKWVTSFLKRGRKAWWLNRRVAIPPRPLWNHGITCCRVCTTTRVWCARVGVWWADARAVSMQSHSGRLQPSSSGDLHSLPVWMCTCINQFPFAWLASENIGSLTPIVGGRRRRWRLVVYVEACWMKVLRERERET